jgi:hypothetical protein
MRPRCPQYGGAARTRYTIYTFPFFVSGAGELICETLLSPGEDVYGVSIDALPKIDTESILLNAEEDKRWVEGYCEPEHLVIRIKRTSA